MVADVTSASMSAATAASAPGMIEGLAAVASSADLASEGTAVVSDEVVRPGDIVNGVSPEQVVIEWYYQEPTTHQPAGPWTVEQLAKKWRRNTINGLTPVWRNGLQAGWTPLAEVAELKDALRAQDGQAEGDEDEDAAHEEDGEVAVGSGTDGGTEPAAKRQRRQQQQQQRRTPLDEVPLMHTYTSDSGELYVYDEVDEDWKASEVYEALLRVEAEAEVELQKLQKKQADSSARQDEDCDQSKSASDTAAKAEQEEALRELLATAGGPSGVSSLLPAAGAPALVASGGGSGRRRPTAELLAHAAASAAAAPTSSSGAGSAPAGASGPGGAKKPTAPPPPAADDDVEAKRQKRRDYRERKKLKKQAGLFVKAQDNPNVYVSGLPPDVTLQELEAIFKRAGVLKVDPDTGGPKIRIYTVVDGESCKGDALVSFANAASVELAVKFLHEFELRPQCRICVQQADFEEHERDPRLSKAELEKMASARKADKERAKYLAAKNAQKEATSWSGEMDDGSGRRIVVLKHMFSLDEAERDGVNFYKELAEEISDECTKVGQVIKVTPLERHRLGIVCVKFKASAEAEECIRVMDGRYFGGRTVEASFYDGVTDLRALGSAQAGAGRSLGATSTTSPGQGPVEDAEPAVAPAPASATIGEGLDPKGAGPELPESPHCALPAPAAASAAVEEKASEVGLAAAPDDPPVPGPAPAGGDKKTWEEWLDDQSSSDEEMQIRTE